MPDVNNIPPLRGPVLGTHGMVASEHPLVSQTGVDVLRRGGNAFDAALAMSALLPVVKPHRNHLGGDAYILAYPKAEGRVTAICSGGKAPAAATPERYPDGIPAHGGGAVAIPGLVDAWQEFHGRWCTMPMADLLAPAISLRARRIRRHARTHADAVGGEGAVREIPRARGRALRRRRAARVRVDPAAARPRGRARRHRDVRTRRVLRGRAGEAHRRRRAGRRRPHDGRRPGVPPRRRAGAAVRRLSRPHRVRDAAELAGPDPARNAQPHRGVRPGRVGASVARRRAPHGRGEEAGVRGPPSLRRRPVASSRSSRSAC